MILDLLFIICVGYGLYMGYQKEPFKHLFKYFPYLIGGLIAIYLSPFLYDKIAVSLNKSSVILFIVIVLICFFLGTSFIRYLVGTITASSKKVKIKKPEKSINALTLAFILAIIFSGLVTFFDRSDIIPESLKESSITLKPLETLPYKIKAAVLRMKPGFKNFYQKSNQVLDGDD